MAYPGGQRGLWVLAMLAGVLLSGCTHGPANPAYDADRQQAQQDLHRMAEDPVPLERPVLVLAGIFDPGIAAEQVAEALREATGDERVVAVSFLLDRSFESMRQRTLEAAAEDFGDEQGDVPEVDVIGISMGGLVARYAAMEDEDGTALRIRRLFTLATPHRGADMARLPAFDQRRHDMRAESDFLADLDAALDEADYAIYPYVRLGDRIVGAQNAAPHGEDELYWLQNRRGEPAHMLVYRDPRIHADIFRRLRGEPPLFEQARALPNP